MVTSIEESNTPHIEGISSSISGRISLNSKSSSWRGLFNDLDFYTLTLKEQDLATKAINHTELIFFRVYANRATKDSSEVDYAAIFYFLLELHGDKQHLLHVGFIKPMLTNHLLNKIHIMLPVNTIRNIAQQIQSATPLSCRGTEDTHGCSGQVNSDT
ncbi:MAG: hypothetical protein ACJAUP_000132 [Cellvibrionaceae bacterium]